MELIEYIKKARDSGMADVIIRQGLLKAGWTLIDIDNALNQSGSVPISLIPQINNSSQPLALFSNKEKVIPDKQDYTTQKTETELPKANLVVLVVTIIIIIGGIVGSVYFLWFNQPQKLQSSNSPETTAENNNSSASVQKLNTNDTNGLLHSYGGEWLTYKDRLNSMELLYPKDWYIFDEEITKKGDTLTFASSKNASTPNEKGLIKKDSTLVYTSVLMSPIFEFERDWKKYDSTYAQISKSYEEAGVYFKYTPISEEITHIGDRTILKKEYTIDTHGRPIGYNLTEGYFIHYAIAESTDVTYNFLLSTELTLTDVTKNHIDLFEQMIKSLKIKSISALIEANKAKENIISLFESLRIGADTLYDDTHSYIGLCDKGIISNYKSLTKPVNAILFATGKSSQKDAGIVCVDKDESYAVSVNIVVDGGVTAKSICVDSTSQAKPGVVDPTSFKCNSPTR